MSEYASAEQRRLVAERAGFRCEYCRIREADTFFDCQVDHIISLKHGGRTEIENLAYACAFCNRHKGSDIASISHERGALVRFFNPRSDTWRSHFEFDGALIKPLTTMGEVTAKILQFNNGDRVVEREALIAIGRYQMEDG